MLQLSKTFRAFMLTGLTSLATLNATASDGIEINHLGANNTLVRVTGDAKYLLLPVQEKNEDAKINILVDGKIAETIFVRLSESKTDYSVPFDLSQYKGKNILLDIVTPQGRNSVREAKEAACWKGMSLADTFDVSNREIKYRPAFHHTPLYGWMNDPNGMVYKDGKWHLYYQYNPYGSKWQNMTWGHSVSTDLINWEHLPNALVPDALGAIFSGSCAVDPDNTAGFGEDAIVALYTSAGTSQMQSLAASNDDGMTFKKFSGNPVITLESEARDPNFFWNEETGEWNMVLAHALDREMLFFTSPDLRNWTLQSSFGRGLGAQDGVWECPDLFELPVDGEDATKWVLLCNINPGGPFGGSAIQYFIGDWDGKTFTADTDAKGNVPTKWLDYGKDNYAAVSWNNAPDSRRTIIGWMSNWQYAAEVPTIQFRSANTLPRDVKLFRGEDGQIYAATEPAPELTALRDKLTVSVGRVSVGSSAKDYTLPSSNGGVCEIELECEAQKADSVTFTISNKKGNRIVMVYDPSKHTMSMDRRESGITDFSASFPAVTYAPTFESNGKITIRAFLDRSSLELFGNDGRFVMTNLVFPEDPYTTLSISSAGGKAIVKNLKIYSIK